MKAWTTADVAAVYKGRGVAAPEAIAMACGGEPAKRGNKFNARKKMIDGILFDSGHEGNCYLRLKAMLAAGLLVKIERQVAFSLQDGFRGVDGRKRRAIHIVVDFVVTFTDGSRKVIEAKSKPTRTRSYLDRRKIFEAKWPHIVFEEWTKEVLA